MPSEITSDSAYAKSIAVLSRATTDYGILASTSQVANYQRVFARDGIICGLAGLLSGETTLIDGLRSTLITLAENSGPVGQIPSNVKIDPDGNIQEVSYGGLAGRVDTNPWFVIGVCNYVHHTGDFEFANRMVPIMNRCLKLLSVWEFNSRGLIYVPQSGDWADEYIFHGYSLHVQVLRIWALRCYATLLGDAQSATKAQELSQLVQTTYWPKKTVEADTNNYHPLARTHYLETFGEPDFYLPCLKPSGYSHQFDSFSNALAVLLGLPQSDQEKKLIHYGQKLIQTLPLKMVPAFWPPIEPEDKDWMDLQDNYSVQFRNEPYHYHNGGSWPMVNGWWGLALLSTGYSEPATDLLNAIHDFNRKSQDSDHDWGFYEFGDTKTGDPKGTQHCSWSAAGAVMVQQGLENKTLFFG